ncbi:hypothetical protein Salmuc_03329 [Salipiger mucosus DSM 16094]|uniref:Uncharacterized protein n=2 Tax=Salipiger mucosus TaxID=263378 RepID=S9QDL5_9RHOB|nr:hypothetical protein Salmuc_03329 [Salipiger mucosus DSM 16094]
MRDFKETVEALGPTLQELNKAIDTSKTAVSEMREGAERVTQDVELRVWRQEHRERAIDGIPRSRTRVADPSAVRPPTGRKEAVIQNFYNAGATE